MKVAMVYPSWESEKAISGYSLTLLNKIKENGIDAESFNYNAGSALSLLKKVNKLKKYDLVHIQHEYNILGGYGLPFFFLYFYLFFSKCKVITTMHTVLSQKESFNENKIKTLLRKILYITQNRWINWFSDTIIVHAGFFKDILSKEYGVSRSKIKVLPQGILENVPYYNKKEIKNELKLSGPVYLLIGSMIPAHGHDIITKQADKIGKTILIVANPGSVNDRNSERTKDYIEYNKEIVKKNNFERFVRFDIGDITDKNPLWWKYFSAADLVLLPYRGGIGSGIFAHAIAEKIPVIASNIKYFEEISRNFEGIRIAKKEEDYPLLIKESMKKEKYKKMKKSCEDYLKKNGLSVIAKKYRDLYLNLNRMK